MKVFHKVHLPRPPETDEHAEGYFMRVPNQVVDLELCGMPSAEGPVVGRDVNLIHPVLGKLGDRRVRIRDLHWNQLEWIAALWAEVCQGCVVDAMNQTALLAWGEWSAFIITEEGRIIKVKNL